MVNSLRLSKLRYGVLKMTTIEKRLRYLRKQIKNENISYGEIAELQSLAKYIDKGDVLLLQWAGIQEK